MKKVLKFGCLSIIAIGILFTVIGFFFSDGEKKETNKEVVVILKDWNVMTEIEKKETIKLMINSTENPYSEHRFRIRLLILKALKNSVKYPETLEFKSLFNNKKWVNSESSSALVADNSQFKIVNYNKGELLITVPFRSESSIGLKIRKTLKLSLIYNGTNSYVIKDAKFIN